MLTAERLTEAVPGFADAEFWFCGPKGFGDALRKGLTARDLPRESFH